MYKCDTCQREFNDRPIKHGVYIETVMHGVILKPCKGSLIYDPYKNMKHESGSVATC
jgi:hypothetical protein